MAPISLYCKMQENKAYEFTDVHDDSADFCYHALRFYTSRKE